MGAQIGVLEVSDKPLDRRGVSTIDGA